MKVLLEKFGAGFLVWNSCTETLLSAKPSREHYGLPCGNVQSLERIIHSTTWKSFSLDSDLDKARAISLCPKKQLPVRVAV